MRRILVIYNPTAGWRRRRRLDAVVERLRARGCAVTVAGTTCRGDAERLARAAGEAAWDVVVAAGGDGTINEVANGLAAADAAPPLAILPLGTANVLAHEIGLACDPDAVARAIADGLARTIHLGVVNGRRFTLMTGVGFDADVVEIVDPWLKRTTGKFAYVVATLSRLLRNRRERYRVVVDGTAYHAASAVVAKGHRYAGPFVCAPEARIDEPKLHVCLFERGGRWAALRYMAALFLGFLPRLPDFRIVPATSVTIELEPGTAEDREAPPVQGDGDVLAHLPAHITLAGRALRLLVPAAA